MSCADSSFRSDREACREREREECLKKEPKKLFEILFYPLISILVFLIIWDIGVRNSELSVVMPGPWEVIIQFLQSFISPIGRYTMPYHMLYSLMRVIPAYIGGSVLGIVLGIMMGNGTPL